MLELGLELLLGLLLAATALYCGRLHRRLGRFAVERAELGAVVERLAVAGERAEAALAAMRGAGDELGARLAAGAERARGAEGRLRRQIEAAEAAARRLDARLHETRQAAGGARPRPAAAPGAGASAALPQAPLPPVTGEAVDGGRQAMLEALRVLR